nr:hypothetical protein [Tanacetum cinerariifolium]
MEILLEPTSNKLLATAIVRKVNNVVQLHALIDGKKATAIVRKVNDVVQLRALIDGKKVVVSEDIIRRDLHLDDADRVECLPNEEIFVELVRLGYEKRPPKLTFYKAFFSAQWKFLIHILVQYLSAKRTAWNKFSCSMASAVICLAAGRNFNFSKYIFDSMVRNVDSPGKILMYPSFLQVVIDNHVDDMTSHNTRYTSFALTQKVFVNMQRVGKGFSGVETPLFASMWVLPQPHAEQEAEEVEVPITPAPSPPALQDPTPIPHTSPPQDQPTSPHDSTMPLLTTLMETYVEEPKKKRVADETLLQESFKKLRAAEVSGSESKQEIPSNDPEEMSKEYVLNMLEILQRYIHAPLTWKLSTDCGVRHVSSTRGHDVFMLTEKDYPLSNAVMILMLSGKLQVEEDNEMARDLVMKIFMEAKKLKIRSLDTSSK